jgi:hypothetical protein
MRSGRAPGGSRIRSGRAPGAGGHREQAGTGRQPDEEQARRGQGGSMKALVSWEDAEGMTHRWEIAYDPDDAEALHFLEGLELHLRFRLETFDAGSEAS